MLVTEKMPTISPSWAGVAPTWTAYSGSSGSMIETPACEMNDSAARIAIGRSMSATADATRAPMVDVTAGA